jgi:hypothetical protein
LTGTGSESQSDRESFIERVDAFAARARLCSDPAREQTKAAIAHAAKEAGDRRASERDISRAVLRAVREPLRQLLGHNEATLEELRRIQPPPEDVRDFARVVDGHAALLAVAAEALRAADHDDDDAFWALQTRMDEEARALDGLARGYGFSVCGRRRDLER